ncbi:sentrin-specific protease 2 [Colius striatus]|uniref:sentrin-specific protease 2 n=1 Tax=Colius striatus TaxID=57412 RepID=UPI002B1E0B41|nr:sentrin-specific protease 2 [Colius striatus]
MYQWLLGALGALLAAARRPPPAAPAPAPPPRRRPSRSVPPSVEDEEQQQVKRRKLDSNHKEEVQDVTAGVKVPAAEEAQSTSSDTSSQVAADSPPDVQVLDVDKMPCEADQGMLSLSPVTIPCLSMCKNGIQHLKPASDSTLMLRPPIKECTAPKSTSSESSRTGRFLCTAEEAIQQREKEKYKELLRLLKEKYSRSRCNPQPTSLHNAQTHSKDPVMTTNHVGNQKQDAVYPCVTLRSGIKHADVCSSQWSQKSEMIRYYTPAENPMEQKRPVKQVMTGCGSGDSEETPFEIHLTPVLPLKTDVLDVEEGKSPSSGQRGECFAPLTKAMDREIKAALGEGNPEEILSSAFKLKVTRGDIQTLRNLCWVNDEVINFYMNLLMARSKKEGYPAIHAFSTFFYPKLLSGGYKAVMRWTRNVDLFKQDMVFVPIHLKLHWALVVVDVRKKSIRYLDSLGQNGHKICETVFKYLQAEHLEKRKLELSCWEWSLCSMEPHEIPQQSNGSDCGIFLCKYADFLSQDKPMTFSQPHMPYFRRRMVWEIIHQQLL